jgi:hypothetical protein
MRNLLFLLVFAVGCVAPAKLLDGRNDKMAHPVAVSYFNRHRNLAAQYCLTQFPGENVYIKGDTVILRDTTYALDSIYVVGDTVFAIRYKTITKSVVVRDTLVKTDTKPFEYWSGLYKNVNDSLQSVKGQVKEKDVQVSKKNKLIRTLLIVFAIEVILLALYIGYKVRKPI